MKLKENNVSDSLANILNEPPEKSWGNFPSKDIPPLFNYGHIYYYALESLPAPDNVYDLEDETDSGLGHMTNKQFANGRKYVDSGFVHDIQDNRTPEHYYIRAHVWPSMRADLPHNVFIVISTQSGAVLHAKCEPCKVSALGRCGHVVAVLILPFYFCLTIMLKSTVRRQLFRALAKTVLGIRGKNARKNQNVFQA